MHPASGRVPRTKSVVQHGRRLLLQALRPDDEDLHHAVHDDGGDMRDGSHVLLFELHERLVRRVSAAGDRERRRGADRRRRRADRNVRPHRRGVHDRRGVLHGAVPRGILRSSAGLIGSAASGVASGGHEGLRARASRFHAGQCVSARGPLADARVRDSRLAYLAAYSPPVTFSA